jgi:hypothetical protein
MLPPLDKVPPGRCGFRVGALWNQIRTRINAQQLIDSDTIKISDVIGGQRIDRVGGGGGAGLNLGFAVSVVGGSLQVAPGRVVSPFWSGATGANFKPAKWDTETNFSGTTLPLSSAAVWLHVQFSDDDMESVGLLATTQIDLSGGAGGRGGGGGGGGASGGDSATTEPQQAGEGDDGEEGGSGGTGAIVVDDPGGDPLVGTSYGHGAAGGAGGIGGDGGDGTTETFTRATKGVVLIRHYTISGISCTATKGTSDETSAWVKLATVSNVGGISIVQHHVGTLVVTPAATTFVDS